MSYRVHKVPGGYMLRGNNNAWTISDESYDAITEYLKQPKPPTIEQRVERLFEIYHPVTLDYGQPIGLLDAMVEEIKAAIDADREARQ